MKTLFVVSTLLLAGCATVQTQVVSTAAQSHQVLETNYTLGVERAVVVGDPIVRVREYVETVTELPSFEANENFRITGGVVSINLSQGERLPIAGQRTADGVTYTIARKGEFGIQVAPDGSIAPGVINGLGTEIQVVMAYRFSTSSPTARLNRVVDRRVGRTQGGQNFEIVFNGSDGQAMRFQYREYTPEDMARPAFSQELSYPLGTRTIRFRQIAIAVRSIDAQEIHYTVTADGRAQQ